MRPEAMPTGDEGPTAGHALPATPAPLPQSTPRTGSDHLEYFGPWVEPEGSILGGHCRVAVRENHAKGQVYRKGGACSSPHSGRLLNHRIRQPVVTIRLWQR